MDIQLLAVAEAEEGPTQLLATDGQYLAYAQHTVVQVVNLSHLTAHPLRLSTDSIHASEIQAISLGHAAIGTSDPPKHHVHTKYAGQALLFTASYDCVLLWRLQQAFEATEHDVPLQPPLTALSGQGSVQALAVCSLTNRLAVCAGSTVHIIDLYQLQHVYRLEGHQGPVLAACFCNPHHPDVLLTTGEDRTFRLWDLHGGALLYESGVLTAAPLVTAAIDPSYFRCAIGAADGVIRFFDLAAVPACRCMHVTDVAQQIQRVTCSLLDQLASQPASAGPKVISARFNSQQPPSLAPEPSCGAVCCGDSILSLAYSQLQSGHQQHNTASLLVESPKLLVGTPRCLGVMDTHNYQFMQLRFYRGSGISTGAIQRGMRVPGLPKLMAYGHPDIDIVNSYAWALADTEQNMVCCAASLEGPEVYVISCTPTADADCVAAEAAEHARLYAPGASEGVEQKQQPLLMCSHPCATEQKVLSVFPTAPPTKDSPLHGTPKRVSSCGDVIKTVPTSPSVKRSSAPSLGNKAASQPGSRRTSSSNASVTSKAPGKLKDQPVTFHKQIKSSGYGFVQPPVKLGKAPPKPVKLDPRQNPANLVARQMLSARQYPVDSDAPTCLQESEVLPENRPAHAGALLCLKFSGDGSRLLSCSADKSARVMKLPISRFQGEGTDLLGHNGAVLDGDWSQDSTLLLTASSDRTARLWRAGSAQPLLEFRCVQRSAKMAQQISPAIGKQGVQSPASKPKPDNASFLHEVVTARFFYLDKFIMLASGNRLNLYNYKLCGGDPKDDISQLKNNNTYQLVASHTTQSQAITTFSVVNVFQSPLALLVTSNRCIEVLDCNTMQAAASIQDAHSRPVHTLVQSAGTSMFTSHPRDMQELFATAATDGLVRLWDLRVCRCVRTLSGHKNSQIRVGASFSPCLRFLAVGSEDTAAHVYDLRQGSLMARLRDYHCQPETVTDVAFNPISPQLALGTLAGGIAFYAP